MVHLPGRFSVGEVFFVLAEGRIDCSVYMGLCRCQVWKIYSIAHLLNYIISVY